MSNVLSGRELNLQIHVVFVDCYVGHASLGVDGAVEDVQQFRTGGECLIEIVLGDRVEMDDELADVFLQRADVSWHFLYK